MIIQLAPEVERAVLAESEATGLTPDEIANKHLAVLAGYKSATISVADLLASLPPDPASDARAKASRERLAALRRDISPEFGPKPGQRFRDWIHEGHKYC
jgi:hypothetical protein